MSCTIGIDIHLGRANLCLIRAGRPAQIAQVPLDPSDRATSLLSAVAQLSPPPRHTLVLGALLPEPEQMHFERQARATGALLVRVMQAGGGCLGTDIARQPGVLCSTAPAAGGVISAWRQAAALGLTRLIACDLSAGDATLCLCDGQPESPLNSRSDPGPPRLALRRVALPHDAPAALHEVCAAIRAALDERSATGRDFALAAYGLRGALHAAHLADNLGISTVFVPVFAGVAGAAGMALSDLRIDVAADLPPGTVLDPYDAAAPPLVQTALLDRDVELPPVPPGLVVLRAAFADLLEHASRLVQLEGLEQDDVVIERYLDAAYAANDAVFTIPADWLADVPRLLAPLPDAFHARFGKAAPQRPVELRRAYVRAVRPADDLPLLVSPPTTASLDEARLDEPPDRADWPHDVPVPLPLFDRARLPVGACVSGPAMIREPFATTHVPPGWSAEVAATLALVLRR